MKIEVTQDDIERGGPRSAYSCPVALAIRRAINSTRVRVDCVVVRVGGRQYWLDRVGSEFVSDFDLGFPVEPTTIELIDPPL